ncbi:MAG TPA: exodeoxyribonuclease V subunit alpha [Kofleriaceae bacterium]|nr:exodeoxyribonuclease V subunit alpha [Kofleriaceae bacterium]
MSDRSTPSSGRSSVTPEGALDVPLSPRGAVRRYLEGDGGAADAWFRKLGIGARRCDLGDQGLYLAEELVGWSPWRSDDERTRFGVFALALLLAVRQGSTRLPLDPKGPGARLIEQVARAAGLEREVEPKKVLAAIAAMGGAMDRVLGPPPVDERATPLVLDDGCVYLHRMWWLEDRLAAALAPRLGVRACGEEAAAGAVERVRASAGLTDEQAAAARAALGFGLSVITGGPGTGKTATLAAIVRALRHLGVAVADLALAAPTGKAAHRMTQALAAALAKAGAAGDVDAELAAAPPVASTLHRLLGAQPGGGFRHDDQNPVPVRVVIVDEASMIDLALMERLVRSLAPGARLVLLGDAHQLPSVDAGQILADLLATADGAPWAVTLTRSFRMDAGTAGGRAILAAAEAVDAGDAARLTRATAGAGKLAVRRARADQVNGDGVELLEAGTRGALDYVDHWWRTRNELVLPYARREYRRRADQTWDAEAAVALDRLLALHESARLLTVTRIGDTGAIALSARCHQRALALTTVTGAPELLPGEPVMHTRNDYARGLWNGDQGVIVRVVDDHGHHYRAVFRRGGELVPFPIEALRGGLELAWAMTVHKSQGSELDQVALVLPDDDSPLATRELVYTALTRARHGVAIVGREAHLAAAIARLSTRSTGLPARLRARAAAARATAASVAFGSLLPGA